MYVLSLKKNHHQERLIRILISEKQDKMEEIENLNGGRSEENTLKRPGYNLLGPLWK